MGITALVLLALVLAGGVYGIQIYNHLVRLKHGVARAWSNIDVALKQRHDEIPKLVEVCKQYMGYERDTLERVVQARGAVAEAGRRQDMGALGRAETALRTVSASCSPWPRAIRTSSPTPASASSRSASRTWRTPSPTAASSTTTAST